MNHHQGIIWAFFTDYTQRCSLHRDRRVTISGVAQEYMTVSGRDRTCIGVPSSETILVGVVIHCWRSKIKQQTSSHTPSLHFLRCCCFHCCLHSFLVSLVFHPSCLVISYWTQYLAVVCNEHCAPSSPEVNCCGHGCQCRYFHPTQPFHRATSD